MLKDILSKFLVLEGVSAVTVISDDGEVIEKLETGVVDDVQLAAVISFVMAEAKAMALRFGDEPLSMLYLEFRDWMLLSAPIREHIFVIVIAKPNANIAQISTEMKKQNQNIANSL